MASNKFFPWNKADKRQLDPSRSGVVVPIPIECISIKGLDCEIASRALSKDPHRPPPLSLDVTNGPGTSRAARSEDSQMLQDAAVQSATSLIAVMNEMLKSPQLSSFITAHQNSMRPAHGRGRANTAPTTPIAEAPSFELAELPGSEPASSFMSRPSQSIDGRSLFSTTLTSSNSSMMGRSIDRLRGSPQNSHYSFSAQHRRSLETSTMRSRSAGPSRGPGYYPESYDFNNEDAQSAIVSRADTPFYPRRMSETNAPGTTNGPARPEMFRFNSGMSGMTSNANEQDAEYVSMQQIDDMRAAHEAHIMSMKESHERELQSLRTYLTILEKRRTGSQPLPSQNLTLDIARSALRPGDQSASTAGTTASVQSFELSLENQRRASNDLMAENEALKRKLSLSRKAQADLGDIRRERDTLRASSENDRRRIGQLKDIVRKAKDDIKSLRSATDDLEARLVAANNERLDALEEFQQAAEKVHKLSLREDELLHDREELCTRLFEADPSWNGVVLGRAAVTASSTLPQADIDLQEQNTSLKRQMAEKDARIAELERSHAIQKAVQTQTQTVDELILIAERAEFEEQLQAYKDRLTYTESERDKYNSLLHAELRRQMRNSMKQPGSLTPKINNEVANTTADRIASVRDKSDSPLEPPSDEGLEMELQKCITEIIMYKLDIKGYKKDIKRAHAEIQGLRSGTTPNPGEMSRSTTSHHRTPTDSEGLGISISELSAVRTPSLPSSAVDKTPSSLPTSAVDRNPPPLIAPPRRPSAASQIFNPSPTNLTRPPLSTEKQLPDPPSSRPIRAAISRQASANTSIKIDRYESHRSYSDTALPTTTRPPTTATVANGLMHKTMTTGHLPRGRNSLPPRPRAGTISPLSEKPMPQSAIAPRMKEGHF